MNLIVFETDLLEREYVLSNKIPNHINTGSVERGAGSISATLDGNGVYETVLFLQHNYFEGDYTRFVDRLDTFIKDLRGYRLINESTKMI